MPDGIDGESKSRTGDQLVSCSCLSAIDASDRATRADPNSLRPLGIDEAQASVLAFFTYRFEVPGNWKGIALSTQLSFLGYCTLALALLVAAPGCTGAKKTGSSARVETTSTASPSSSEREEEERREEEEGEADRAVNEAMEKALDAALNQGWSDLHMVCECAFENGWRSVELFKGGAGVLDNAVQFSMDRSQIGSLLEEFRRLRFAEMRRSYGVGEVDEEFAIRVICRVSLSLDGVSKQVLQFDKGRQSEELRELAQFLLEASENPANNGGVRADDLHDALIKLAQGELAPETLDLTVNRKPDPQELKAGVPGWVIHVAGRVATARAYLPEGLGENLELVLDAAEIQDLASVLSEQSFDALPGNLFSRHYTDMAVRVLRWKKDVQARQFAGMTSETDAPSQRRFLTAFAAVGRIAQKVLAEGKASVH